LATGRQSQQFVGEVAGAHVQTGKHGFELGHGERGAQLGPDGFPLVAPQVHQAVEQHVVFERRPAHQPVVERPELRGQDRVHQDRVAHHQHGVSELVQPEVPVAGEPSVERVHGDGARLAAHRGPGEVAQQRHRFGVRHAQRRPVSVVARTVHVRQ